MLTNVPPTATEQFLELQDEQQFAGRPEIPLLEGALGKGYLGWSGFQGNLTIAVAPEAAVEALRLLRDEGGYDHFSYMTASHWPETPREAFHFVYQLYSRQHATWVRLKCFLPAPREQHGPIALPTATGVYPAADWHECEAWDLLGIHFDGHPNLRRLLTPGMYEGFPLRRDFPLEGAELRAFQTQLIEQWNSDPDHTDKGSTDDFWIDRYFS
ncbi:MAG TPA: NADH-quinone oxidoreductase subunit C [bacterium]|nr:NADH-quinone oxidoreductase subunit C [bacterium]